MIAELLALIVELSLVIAAVVAVKAVTHTTYRQLIRICLKIVACAYVVLFAWIIYLRYEYPPVSAIGIQRSIEGLFQGGAVQPQRQFVPLADISPDVIHAVIVGEDPAFLYHRGVDWSAIRYKLNLAVRTNTRFVGASTITQQLAKNLFLPSCRSYSRKAVELTIVPLLEWVLPKRRILELYLGVVEWGDGVYGIQAAALHYYDVPAAALNREQSARLVAVLPNPQRRDPLLQHETSARILAQMAIRGW